MNTKLHRREPHRLIRLPEVLRKVGVSQSTWYEDVKEKRAPSPPLSTLDTSPLDGMRLKLERKIDHKKGCCRNFAIVRGGKGPHAAELKCAGCGKHRGWLPHFAANWLLTLLAFFPEAKNDVHTIRDSKK